MNDRTVAGGTSSINENLRRSFALLKRPAVPPLEPSDIHLLSASIGWLELGNPSEAESELRRIAGAAAGHPDVLEVWYALHASRRDWPAALRVAEQLVAEAPGRASGWLHRAYALRRVPGGGLNAAWDALFPAAEKFPRERTISYNLACYACQLNRLEETVDWLRRALRGADGEERAWIAQMVETDSDLAPLREEAPQLLKSLDDLQR